ncbi:DUF7507 domain-containing protein, partial [Tabrizicola oligotrophica]
TVEATYTVQQADIDGDGIDLNGLVDGDGDVDNTATADSDETEEVSDSEDVPVCYDPVLSIDKVVLNVGGDGPDGVADEAGDEIEYRITVTNDGNVTLTNVTVVDPLTGEDVDVGDLAPGASYTILASYFVTQADIDGNGVDLNGDVDGDGDVDNTATADSNETDEVSDSEIVLIDYSPDIDLEKYVDVGQGFEDADQPTGTEVDIAGGMADFMITIENTGNVTLTEVTISDTDTFGTVIDGMTLQDLYNAGYDLQESITNDGILEVGETATLLYSMALTAGQHINTADVTTAEGVSDEDLAHYFGLVNEGPGVRTPGGWGNSFKLQSFWNGNPDDQVPYEGKPGFPDGELLYAVDSTGNGAIDGADKKGLLLGDFNGDGLEGAGETTIFISYEIALAMVQNANWGPKQDKVDDVARHAVATWLNFLAGNNIGDDSDGTPKDWLEEAVAWLLANGDKNDDGVFGDYDIVRAKDKPWNQDVNGVESGSEILDALDEYNNHGTIDGVIYAHDADDAAFQTALAIYNDEFLFV